MLSNKELIAKIKSEHANSKPTDFPTAIVELPSKGLLYEKSNPLSSGKVMMRYMDYRAEEILTDSTYITEGTAYDELCKYLIVSNDSGQIIDYNTLTLFDRDAIFIAARVLGKGSKLKNTVSCKNPSCKHIYIHDVDLTELDDYDYDFSPYWVEPHSNKFQYKLELGDGAYDDIVFKMLSVEDDANIIRHQNSNGKFKERTLRLLYRIVSVNGVTDRDAIEQYVTRNLITLYSERLRDYINQVNKNYKLTYKSKCPKCGETHTHYVVIGRDFFRLQP